MRPLPQRTEILLVGLLLAVSLARIIATYPVFAQTYDEPAHIAAGMEWLDRKTYWMTPYNPPLPRVLVALGPRLDGARFRFVRDTSAVVIRSSAKATGNEILYSGDYQRRLTLARFGTLPLLIAAALLVWWWARRLGGQWAGLIALLLVTNLPMVLAHAGLATTDVACAASVAAALFAFSLCLERPGIRTALLLGAAIAFAVLSKFSALFFVPAGAIATLAVLGIERRATDLRRVAMAIGGALLVALPLIWAAYRFSFYTVPAPELVAGVRMLARVNLNNPYPAYFLGQVDPKGTPLYFPLLLLVKTPLPFLLLWLAAFALARRVPSLRVPLAASVAILLCGFLMAQGGLRYLLPIYPLAAIAAALAATALWQRGLVWRTLVGLLLAAHVIVAALAHPDYLPYFNALAGRHPERIVVDVDLDWGQDLLRLREPVRELGIRELHLAYFGSADPLRHDLGTRIDILPPNQPRHGWIAVSESYRYPIWTDGYLWITKHQPVRRVGRSMWLYNIPAAP